MSDERQQQILDIVRDTGVVSVDDLVERFAVTPQTIRKDLNTLSGQRMLTRTHGGARLACSIENMSHEARRVLAAEQKHSIGRAAAGIVADSTSLFITVGTTAEAVAQALLQHRKLMVVTNNINIAALMRPYVHLDVLIAPGIVRPSDGGVVGDAAVEFIRQFKLDYAVIGCSAIDRDGSLLDFDFREVKVAQAVLDNARHVILVTDAGKHERAAPVRIGHISQVQSLVTDRLPDNDFRNAVAELDLHVIETDRA